MVLLVLSCPVDEEPNWSTNSLQGDNSVMKLLRRQPPRRATTLWSIPLLNCDPGLHILSSGYSSILYPASKRTGDDRRKKLYKELSLAMKHGFITMILKANRNPCNGNIRVLHPQRSLKVQHSAGKVMATVFWDSEGILLIDYLPRKTTMNGNYYAEVLGKLEKAIKEKRKEKFKNGILLLHDNAPVHKAGVVQDALKKLKFQELNHPPYSPDLAPYMVLIYGEALSNAGAARRLYMERFPDRQVPCARTFSCHPKSRPFKISACLRLKFCKLLRKNRMLVADDLHYEWVFPVSQFGERCTNKDYIVIIFNVSNT
ncbi:hypothetical protein GEV33_001670 [Tenebrio molitor]|uniref:DUF4817 domain-containing protein n=1 Tax=Tenebrio molitor TaxID=7067 RepID=A0A8J6LPZ7_TENMO|nr:hypothetical protein GEV33_001670 [Tenebrio molitor]